MKIILFVKLLIKIRQTVYEKLLGMISLMMQEKENN